MSRELAEAAVEVECPGCGATRTIDGFRRTAGEFCRECDYPLFWAPAADQARAAASNGTGLDGPRPAKTARATMPCPACDEPNPTIRSRCLRCNADLHPPPPVAEPEPVLPVAEPAPPSPPPWWQRIRPVHVAVAAAALGVFQLLLLAAR